MRYLKTLIPSEKKEPPSLGQKPSPESPSVVVFAYLSCPVIFIILQLLFRQADLSGRGGKTKKVTTYSVIRRKASRKEKPSDDFKIHLSNPYPKTHFPRSGKPSLSRSTLRVLDMTVEL